MYAHRIDIFHIADGDHITGTVTHYLVLDLFPAGDTALHQYLSHAGKTQTVLQDLFEFHLIVRDTAAAAAQGIRRTQYHGVTDRFGKCHTVFHGLYHLGRCTRFADRFHRILKCLPVFRLTDRLCRRSQQPHVMLF